MQIASPRVQTPRGVCPPLDLHSRPSQSSMLTGSPASERSMPDAIPFQGLELGYVLGRGAFGSVYQGTYNGKPVAVKVGLSSMSADSQPLSLWEVYSACVAWPPAPCCTALRYWSSRCDLSLRHPLVRTLSFDTLPSCQNRIVWQRVEC